MKNVASNYYMMKKIHQKSSLHQLTKNKNVIWSCVPRTEKCGVRKKWNGPIRHPMPQQLSSPQIKWWDTRVLGLVRLILKLLKKQETRNNWPSPFFS